MANRDVTTAMLEKFEEAIRNFDRKGRWDALASGLDPKIIDAQRAALVAQADDLREQLATLEA